MYTKPSIQDMIQAAMASLSQDIAPELQSNRPRVCLTMVQTMLQCVIQRVDREHQYLIADHNEMTALYRTLAEQLHDSAGAEAERIRQRGASLGRLPDIPAPCPDRELADAHHRLSEGLIETLTDIDQLLRAGDANAKEALRLLRGHLTARSLRECQTLMVNPGSLAGRE